jgi:hypothetical protein
MLRFVACSIYLGCTDQAAAKEVEAEGNSTTFTYDPVAEITPLVYDLNAKEEFDGLLVSRYRACNGDQACMKLPIAGGACLVGIAAGNGAWMARGGDIRVELKLDATRTDKVPHGSGFNPNAKILDLTATYRGSDGKRQSSVQKVYAYDLGFHFIQSTSDPKIDKAVNTTTGPRDFGLRFHVDDQVNDIRVAICDADLDYFKVVGLTVITTQDPAR